MYCIISYGRLLKTWVGGGKFNGPGYASNLKLKTFVNQYVFVMVRVYSFLEMVVVYIVLRHQF